MSENQIYVACLAAYNNGHLHGEWIDATMGYDTVMESIREMLKASPIPNAEEWAIHDYDGELSGLGLGEYEDLETVCTLAEKLEEIGEPFGAFYQWAGSLDTAVEHFEDAYQGTYGSEEEYAQAWCDEMEALKDVPSYIQYHINWEGVARDMFINDVHSEELSNRHIAVFSNNW